MSDSLLPTKLQAMHTLAANLAVYYTAGMALCRYCKSQLRLGHPTENHDLLCPLTRVMSGDPAMLAQLAGQGEFIGSYADELRRVLD